MLIILDLVLKLSILLLMSLMVDFLLIFDPVSLFFSIKYMTVGKHIPHKKSPGIAMSKLSSRWVPDQHYCSKVKNM